MSRNKRIYIFSFTFYPEKNGVSNVAKRQADYFHDKGYDVNIVTGSGDESELLPYPVYRFCVTGNSLAYSFYRGDIRKYIKFLNSLEDSILIFHCWQIWTTDLACFSNVFKKNKVKTILFSHGIGVNTSNSVRDNINRVLYLPYRLLVKSLLKKFDRLFFLSDKGDDDRFLDRSWVNSDEQLKLKSKTISNGCNLRGVDVPNVKEDMSEDYCIYVSNYQEGKNQREAIDIIVRLNTFRKINLVLIGAYNSHYLDTLKRYVEGLNATCEIHFLVGLSNTDIDAYYKNAKFTLFTSLNECMPLVVLESIEHGIPVISSDVGNVRDIDGVLVYKDLDDAVNQCLVFTDNNEERLRYSDLGLQYVAANTWDIKLELLEVEINKLCQEK